MEWIVFTKSNQVTPPQKEASAHDHLSAAVPSGEEL
jgi:hypothetical protein